MTLIASLLLAAALLAPPVLNGVGGGPYSAVDNGVGGGPYAAVSGGGH